ncbi:MAG: DNA-protecting protein DprA [Candidatus Buchananbacteria bacterium CG10_big_fil_rev_8_21_14_0_10_42_9]|uniref:DNA-protecting protein DprA n=1 Tax=Candidatus Buchananbacteria bacterium CG10_big_fil_rev_8_21_14_0_10_42_9 TaxID=1974526 RepID=A0A2H0W3A5_9BACT|nr:MAG: DNA-protecting protein DprA [Candidatus Buchananbacteria bacterium CG10_big_fil_rev_8_21_14_0_10_42_9]
MKDNELQYWLGFNALWSVGPTRFKALFNYFPTLETAWNANLSQLRQAGFSDKVAAKIVSERKNVNPAELLENLKKDELNVLTQKNPEFPSLLQGIYDPPMLLYYKGKLECVSKLCLAVVGPRKASNYGKNITQELIKDLAPYNITIVSGLALGIDAIAHQAALDTNLATIAVLGSGLNKIFPIHNQGIAQDIINSGGLILSEFEPEMHANKQTFPIRNRIISGLCSATLIVEAGAKSGALVTAECALDQGREVLSVPGNITSLQSHGTNKLIKDGATIVTNANDILNALNLTENKISSTNIPIAFSSESEKQIYELLIQQGMTVDTIIDTTKLDPAVVHATISTLELKGYTSNHE